MSFGWTAATWLAIGSAATAAVGTAYSTDQARKGANNANDLSKANALKNQQAADEANNAANARSPDGAAAAARNAMSAQAGQSGTMLTGPSGIDATQLTLGKQTLLGG